MTPFSFKPHAALQSSRREHLKRDVQAFGNQAVEGINGIKPNGPARITAGRRAKYRPISWRGNFFSTQAQLPAWEDAMHDEIYTDGIDEIMVGGSIVRVDIFSLSPTERDANNTPKKVFRQRIIFPIEAFANSVEVMQNALQGLVDAGVVKRNAPRAQSEPLRASKTTLESKDPNHPQNPRTPNASTNFR